MIFIGEAHRMHSMTERTADRRNDGEQPALGHAVYGISVASELTDIPVQTLRLWERQGLLNPHRSPGGTRRFSGDDLARIRRIAALVGTGVNLTGVAQILELQDDNDTLRTAAGGEPDPEENPSKHTQRVQ
jgi:MerR family transcriptional regulator, heat shock protein HspR